MRLLAFRKRLYKIQQEKEEHAMDEIRYALIPAYQPDQRLIKITEQLAANGFQVVVVDDGSGAEYADLFFELLPFADVVTHKGNRGKGAALKTGLRAFSNQDVVFMRQIDGERYEYEINVLLEYAKHNRKICEVPIATIYLDDNKSSHFHAVRDGE